MQRLPNLAPAPHKPEPPAPPQPQQPQTARPRVARASSSRKYATNHACVPYRKTKTKCDGRQPCARCQFSSNVCTYDTKVLSGETLNRLTNAVNEQKGRLHQLETILAAMRNGTDPEAAEVMSWIRIGESVESIVSYIESRSRAVVVTQRLVGVNHQAKSKFIETLFDRAEWLDWAMMTANDGHGVDSVTKAWADTLKKARQLVTEGAKPDDLTGTFPCVAALFDKDEYENAPMISKWAVQFIYSARRQDYAFTSMAAVWVVWVVMRWQINPTPQTYADLPDWIRPTELQVFVPHIDMLDCISWPYFRDYVIQHPEMQHGELQWLAACTSGVQVKWDGTIEDALCIDGPTGRKRFTAEAEATIRDLQKWSLAASYRAFMPGIDGQIPIRTAEDAGVQQV